MVVSTQRSQTDAAQPFSDRFVERVISHGHARSWSSSQLAEWLTDAQLAPLAAHYLHERPAHQQLDRLLQPTLHHARALNLLQKELLEQIEIVFGRLQFDLKPIVLKGGALARTVYPHPATRPMGDIDLWLPDKMIKPLISELEKVGFRWIEKTVGDHQLKTGRSGEYQLVYPAWQNLLVELHATPFPGWWLDQTTPLAADEGAVWKRAVPLSDTPGWRQLEPADGLIHLAVHLIVNHQFSLHPLRSLVDIALLIEESAPAWPAVVQRAAQWRLRPVVWLALKRARSIWAIDLPDGLLDELAPRPAQQRLLEWLVADDAVWQERDLSGSWWRYALLLALVERPADRRRLFRTAVWPRPADLPDGDQKRLRRLWHLLIRREL